MTKMTPTNPTALRKTPSNNLAVVMQLTPLLMLISVWVPASVKMRGWRTCVFGCSFVSVGRYVILGELLASCT